MNKAGLSAPALLARPEAGLFCEGFFRTRLMSPVTTNSPVSNPAFPSGGSTTQGGAPFKLLSTPAIDQGQLPSLNSSMGGSTRNIAQPGADTMQQRDLADAKERAVQSIKTIDANPNLAPDIKAEARRDPGTRAFLGDEKVSYETLQEAQSNLALKNFIYGAPIVNENTGPISQVHRNAPPVTVTQPFREKNAYPAELSLPGGPQHTRGYRAISEEQRPLLNVDPDKVLESSHSARKEHAAEFRFEAALKQGQPAREALQDLEKNRENGVKASPMRALQRQPGDLIGLYDRSLQAKATAAALDRGAFKDQNLDNQVLVPVKYENEEHIRQCIGRSYKYLAAPAELQAKVRDGDLKYLQSQERRLVLERLAQRSGKTAAEVLSNQ